MLSHQYTLEPDSTKKRGILGSFWFGLVCCRPALIIHTDLIWVQNEMGKKAFELGKGQTY